MAPEMIMRKEYSQSVDVWACGCIIYCLLSGTPPFEEPKITRLMNKIKRGKWGFKSTSWNDVSFEAKDIIKKMLKTDPEQRFTIEQALKHDWMTKDIARKSSIKLTKAQKKMEENFSSKRFKRSVNKIIAINRLSNRLSFNSMGDSSFRDSGSFSIANGSFNMKDSGSFADGSFVNGSFVLPKPDDLGSGAPSHSSDGSKGAMESSDGSAVMPLRSGVSKLQPQMSMVQEDHRELTKTMSVLTDISVSEKHLSSSATPADKLFAGMAEEKREEAVDEAAAAGARSSGTSAAHVPGVAITSQPTAMQGGDGEHDGLGRDADADVNGRAAQLTASPSSAAQVPGRPSDAGAGPTSPDARDGIAAIPTPSRPRLPSGIGKLSAPKPGGSSERAALLQAPVGSLGISHGSGASLRGSLGNRTALPALDKKPSLLAQKQGKCGAASAF
mmetsp:Transcript_21823/g.50255  ORF Transcript_21823/g.50255 Transcript_21823/m.50255 type:complete len:443 (+) Transcript_21823:997-2325(+)